MVEVVSILVNSLVSIGVILALFFGFKYWVDKGGVDKITTKINDDLTTRNTRLRKEVRVQQEIIKNYQTLLKIREQEIIELSSKEVELSSTEGEEANDQTDGE